MSATGMKRAPAKNVAKAAPKRARRDAGAAADMEDLFTAEQAQDIQSSLLEWYDANHRVLPWRRNPHSKLTPEAAADGEGAPLDMPQQQFMYWVWVCEVMSQQTQVPRAAEYFKRWTARWPTVQDLARASEEEVNEAWAGLGYYRRARFLLQGARYVVGDLGGTFPGTSAELQKIPGVGPYTGAAMASIAAGEVVAVVDANVMRVLARLRCLDWELKDVKRFARVAGALVDPERPGCFNQAVMELGARVCTIHQAPACAACPIARHCAAREQGRAGDFPVKAAKAAKREEFAAVCVVQLERADSEGDSHFLLVKRPGTGLLAGLWEFPSQLTDAESSREQLRALMDGYLEAELGVPLGAGGLRTVSRQHLGSLTHVFSHIRLTLSVERLLLRGDLDTSSRPADEGSGRPALRWVAAGAIGGEGLSSSVKKVLALVEKAGERQRGGIAKFLVSKKQ